MSVLKKHYVILVKLFFENMVDVLESNLKFLNENLYSTRKYSTLFHYKTRCVVEYIYIRTLN